MNTQYSEEQQPKSSYQISEGSSNFSIDSKSASTEKPQVITKNRWIVRAYKNSVLIEDQITSGLITEDSGKENFYARVAASQVEENHYQETRIRPINEVRKRIFESYQKAKSQREELEKEEAKRELDLYN